MRHLLTLTTVALFLSSTAYAAEVCDPLADNGCVCEKIPVMSEDGKRILYHTMSTSCRYTTSGGSSLFTLADVRPNPGPSPDNTDNTDNNDDHESDDNNDDHESDDHDDDDHESDNDHDE